MSRSGFTIVELLAAMSLFLVLALAFTALLTNGASHLNTAKKLRQTTCVLQAELEKIQTLSFDRLMPLDGSGFASGEGSIKVAPAAAGLLLIKLQLNGRELLTLRNNR